SLTVRRLSVALTTSVSVAGSFTRKRPATFSVRPRATVASARPTTFVSRGRASGGGGGGPGGGGPSTWTVVVPVSFAGLMSDWSACAVAVTVASPASDNVTTNRMWPSDGNPER